MKKEMITDGKTAKEDKVVNSLYLHIFNGGVNFSVVDTENGPQIHINSSTFGTNAITQRIHVKKEALTALSKMFANAANYEHFSEPYCNAAELPWESSGDDSDDGKDFD